MRFVPQESQSEVGPRIKFNQVYLVGTEFEYIKEALANGTLKSDGKFTQLCQQWLENALGARKAVLTTSCTAGLEMAALLCEVSPGDEVILPSFTFPTSASAFLLRGAKLIFADIDPRTMNIDPDDIKRKLSERTKVICPVHYAGIPADMSAIMPLARAENIYVVEDAAQGVMSRLDGKALGTIGDFGAYSFHETKNYISGEGGAILVNNPDFIERCEIIKEKGTNRLQYLRGEVDNYTWVALGSSFAPSDVLAAILWSQLECAQRILDLRMKCWQQYAIALRPLAQEGKIALPYIPPGVEHNAHIFYILVDSHDTQLDLLEYLKTHNIDATFHFIPLHTSPMGHKLKTHQQSLPVTEEYSHRLIRLPLYPALTASQINRITQAIFDYFRLYRH